MPSKYCDNGSFNAVSSNQCVCCQSFINPYAKHDGNTPGIQFQTNQQIGQLASPPPSIFLLVEGKPGSGKSFILKTLWNITRAIMKFNNAELTSAPTGVAGSLINASTHCRVASLPTGKDASKLPCKVKTTNYEQVMSLAISHQSIFTRLMDENSMMGRKQFGWMKHQMEEL